MTPFRGYYAHKSTTTEEGRALETHLQYRWSQVGLRTRDDHPDDHLRDVCRVHRKSLEDRVPGEVDFPAMHDDTPRVTQAPPRTPTASSPNAHATSARRAPTTTSASVGNC